MKKNAVIISVDTDRTSSEYDKYLNGLRRIDWRIEGLEKLGEDVWLIPLPTGLPCLSQIIAACEFVSYKYKILHIEHEPVWVNYNGGNKPVSQ